MKMVRKSLKVQLVEKLTLVCACVILKSLCQLSRSNVVLKPFCRFKLFQVCFPKISQAQTTESFSYLNL